MAVRKKKKKSKSKPRIHGSTDGRNTEGKFIKGNQCSVGNASSGDRRAKELKKALYDAITAEDIKEIIDKLKEKAKAGDTTAAKEIFDRLWGRAKQEIDVEHSGSISFTEALSKATRTGEKDD